MTKPRAIQVYHPLSNRWVKVDTRTGRVFRVKKSAGPWRGVLIGNAAKLNEAYNKQRRDYAGRPEGEKRLPHWPLKFTVETAK